MPTQKDTDITNRPTLTRKLLSLPLVCVRNFSGFELQDRSTTLHIYSHEDSAFGPQPLMVAGAKLQKVLKLTKKKAEKFARYGKNLFLRRQELSRTFQRGCKKRVLVGLCAPCER
jgi:hypothetical protein